MKNPPLPDGGKAIIIELFRSSHNRTTRVLNLGETGLWNERGKLSIEKIPAWISRLEKDAWITGPGLRSYESSLPPGTLMVSDTNWDPRPESLLQLGLPMFRAGVRHDVFALEPIYHRPSSAELKWQKPSPA